MRMAGPLVNYLVQATLSIFAISLTHSVLLGGYFAISRWLNKKVTTLSLSGQFSPPPPSRLFAGPRA